MTETTHTPSNPGNLISPKRHPLVHLSHPDHHIPGYELPETASRPPSRLACVLGFGVAVVLAVAGWLLRWSGEGAVAPDVPLPWVSPFVALLACIAIAPFAARKFWEHNYQWVSLGLGAIVAAYYMFGISYPKVIAETFSDYISFIILLGSLFVVSGGVVIRVRRRVSPAVNTALLLAGAILANVFGTTGAAMLLIRPFMRLNKGRMRAHHVVFFIFIVANVGGALTPVGDPPLFLGYLKGVPFWWVLQHAWPIWLTAIGGLSILFFLVDSYHSRKDSRTPERHDPADGAVISILGGANLLFIGVVLAGVFCPSPFREILMAGAAFASLATTSPRIYGENHFNYAPIKEVALLFVGIFATMVPTMNYLHHHATDPFFQRYLNTPGQFYFASGSLSSVLDNAPTYVTFLESSLGKNTSAGPIIDREKEILRQRRLQLAPADTAGLAATDARTLLRLHTTLIRYHGDQILAGALDRNAVELAFMLDDSGELSDGPHPFFKFLLAISMGAVFFGACTYIGNGPNFMVKSIAEHAGVKAPGFFSYILLFTLPYLLPILILCWALFLRH
jgi:Na+/H+ antiporter NhaD/arsenite permease-like protein